MEQLLSVEELAKRLRVPVSWVYDRTRRGHPERIPHLKVGRYVRFSEAEIAVYLELRKEPKLSREHCVAVGAE